MRVVQTPPPFKTHRGCKLLHSLELSLRTVSLSFVKIAQNLPC